MSEKRLDNAEEKLDCKKKYLYEYAMFWECNEGSKCQILEDDVVDLLNEQQTEIAELREAIDYLKTVIRYTIPNQMVADVFKYIGEDYE